MSENMCESVYLSVSMCECVFECVYLSGSDCECVWLSSYTHALKKPRVVSSNPTLAENIPVSLHFLPTQSTQL